MGMTVQRKRTRMDRAWSRTDDSSVCCCWNEARHPIQNIPTTRKNSIPAFLLPLCLILVFSSTTSLLLVLIHSQTPTTIVNHHLDHPDDLIPQSPLTIRTMMSRRHQEQRNVSSIVPNRQSVDSHQQQLPVLSHDNHTMIQSKLMQPQTHKKIIFVASLPKSGTTSIWKYFLCGNYSNSYHQWINKDNGTIPIGECVRNNQFMNRPTFYNCGDPSNPYATEVYTDTGYARRLKSGQVDCFYPSIQALKDMAHHHKDITVLLVTRNSTEWFQSLASWGHGSLLERWKDCSFLRYFMYKYNLTSWVQFYEHHTRYIVETAQALNITIHKVPLEDPATGVRLQSLFGIPPTCWKNCRPNRLKCRSS